jgi:hypothetical protein
LAKISPASPRGYRTMCSRRNPASQPGSGTVRRPAVVLGNGLNEVCPATSITVRITRSGVDGPERCALPGVI